MQDYTYRICSREVSNNTVICQMHTCKIEHKVFTAGKFYTIQSYVTCTHAKLYIKYSQQGSFRRYSHVTINAPDANIVKVYICLLANGV
jgi:hypothetical protein